MKAKTISREVEYFHMTASAMQDRESWPEWLKDDPDLYIYLACIKDDCRIIVKHADSELAQVLNPAQFAKEYEAVDVITEKDRRIYYQSIVYSVCNAIDELYGNHPGAGIVCGTANSPSTAVEERIKLLLRELQKLRHPAQFAKEYEAIPDVRCPHCGSPILWSEDRGAHCDGCDEYEPHPVPLSFSPFVQRYSVVSDGFEYTVWDNEKKCDLFPTKSGNRDYSCKQCPESIAHQIATALNLASGIGGEG